MNFTIRQAIPSDINDIIVLCALHADYEKAEYNPKGKAEKLAKDLFREQPRLYCLVAQIENKTIGYLTYMFEYSTWDAELYGHMDCLYLKEEARGFGIGESLINHAKIACKENNIKIIQWQTPVFNERAIKFYYRIGATSKEKLRMYLTI